MDAQETKSPLRGITAGYNVGEQFAAGLRDYVPTARLAVLRFQWKSALIQPKRRADNAQRHADWYCSLPWYGRWWAMVRGK